MAIISLSASAFEVAPLRACEVVPLVLFGLPAGVSVDRLRRRPLLIVSDLGRAAVLASIPIAYALDVISIGQLYVAWSPVRSIRALPAAPLDSPLDLAAAGPANA